MRHPRGRSRLRADRARRIAGRGAMGLLLGVLVSCGHSAERRAASKCLAPENWVVARPSDTVSRVGGDQAPVQAVAPQRNFDSAEIEVQGDSMTVEVSDPTGRSTLWNSWVGVISGGSLPGCKLEGTRISEVTPGETAPFIGYYLTSPISGTYRIQVLAHNTAQVFLTVGRRHNGRVMYGGANDERWIKRGKLAGWVADLSPASTDSCWVHLRRDTR